MAGVSECSQQRGNLKDNGYTCFSFAGWKGSYNENQFTDNCRY
ncbi:MULTISPECIES: hypothetical protein [Photorhabdus]|nr:MULTISPECIES: hypothetical protein [Photorhabdus]